MQPRARLLTPSAHSLNETAGFHVLAGNVSGFVDVLNMSKRSPALIVARLIVQ